MAAFSKNEKLAIVQADILGMEVQAIVNPTNTDLLMGAGLAGEIRKQAGSKVQEDCLEIGSINIGQTVVTEGGGLKAAHIIHAATMKIGGVTTENNLIAAIESTSRRVNDMKLATIAFPPMGIGVGRFPLRRCAEVMIQTILATVTNRKCLSKAYIVLADEETFNLFHETYERLTSEPGEAGDQAAVNEVNTESGAGSPLQ